MFTCSHEYPEKKMLEYGARYERTKDIDLVLQRTCADTEDAGLFFVKRPERRGDEILFTKVPCDPAGYKQAMDDAERRFCYCHWDGVRELTRGRGRRHPGGLLRMRGRLVRDPVGRYHRRAGEGGDCRVRPSRGRLLHLWDEAAPVVCVFELCRGAQASVGLFWETYLCRDDQHPPKSGACRAPLGDSTGLGTLNGHLSSSGTFKGRLA